MGSTRIPLSSSPFTIPRVIFARLTAELYVRRFWFLLLPWPMLALGLIFLSRDRNIMLLALLVGLWPLTIPIRSYFFTSKVARMMESPVWVSLDDGWLLFHPEAGAGFKLDLNRISFVTELHNYLAIVVGQVKVTFVPVSAFSTKAEAERFRRALIDAN